MPEIINEKEINILDFFPTEEAGLYQFFGRVGQGKTYLATDMVFERLKKGRVVYTNWPIEWDGLDETKSIKSLFLRLLGRKKLLKIHKENLRRIEIDENFVDKLEKLTDCDVFIDEGHVVFDSYEMARMSIQKRKAVLHTRHFDRSIYVISQRFTAIHPTIRENVNSYYQCEKWLHWGKFIIFRRTELDALDDNKLDFENPISTKLIIGSQRVFEAYNSKYLRYDMKSSQRPEFEVIELSKREALSAIWRAFRPPDDTS